MTIFGENVRKRRLELGMTQQDLADGVGAIQNHISKIELGTVAPSVFLAQDIAFHLDVNINTLLRIDKPGKKRKLKKS